MDHSRTPFRASSRAPSALARRLAPALLGVGLAGIAPAALAQDGVESSAEACEEAARLVRDDDLDGALAEAKWCLESLQQLERDRTLAVFPDAVEGYEGGELETQGAMGMTMTNRSYAGDDGTIDVSLTAGAAGSGLAALAQMGMTLGGAGRKLRVQRRTVIDTSESEGSASFLVELRSGGMLSVSSPDVPPAEVLEFVEAFPIEALDDAMKR